MLFSVCHHQIQPVLFGWSAGGGRGRSPIVYGPVGTGVICVRWAVWLCPGFDACGWFCFFFSSEPALVLCACVYHRPDPFLWVVCHGSHPVLSCGVPACVVVPCWRAGLVGFLTLPFVPLAPLILIKFSDSYFTKNYSPKYLLRIAGYFSTKSARSH